MGAKILAFVLGAGVALGVYTVVGAATPHKARDLTQQLERARFERNWYQDHAEKLLSEMRRDCTCKP